MTFFKKKDKKLHFTLRDAPPEGLRSVPTCSDTHTHREPERHPPHPVISTDAESLRPPATETCNDNCNTIALVPVVLLAPGKDTDILSR